MCRTSKARKTSLPVERYPVTCAGGHEALGCPGCTDVSSSFRSSDTCCKRLPRPSELLTDRYQYPAVTVERLSAHKSRDGDSHSHWDQGFQHPSRHHCAHYRQEPHICDFQRQRRSGDHKRLRQRGQSARSLERHYQYEPQQRCFGRAQGMPGVQHVAKIRSALCAFVQTLLLPISGLPNCLWVSVFVSCILLCRCTVPGSTRHTSV